MTSSLCNGISVCVLQCCSKHRRRQSCAVFAGFFLVAAPNSTARPQLFHSNLPALVQQLLAASDAAMFVTGEQKEKLQMADWRVRVASPQQQDLQLPPAMMAYATGDVQFLAPVFVALANRCRRMAFVSLCTACCAPSSNYE